MESTTFKWIDVQSEETGSFILTELPFDFYFYGEKQDNKLLLGMDGTGFLRFIDELPRDFFPTAHQFPTQKYNDRDNYLAVCHSDYLLNGKLHCDVIGSKPDRRMIISWVDTSYMSLNTKTPPLTFQIILEETTNDIIYQYKDVGAQIPEFMAGKRGVIGLQDDEGLFGKQYSFNGSTPLTNNFALRFHHKPLDTVEATGGTTTSGTTGTDAGGGGGCGLGGGSLAILSGLLLALRLALMALGGHGNHGAPITPTQRR
jgi:hypothetical protein